MTTLYTLYFSNNLFPFAFFSTIDLRKYIARSLYKNFIYFPIEFEIERNSINGKKIKFKLFKIESSLTLFSKKKNRKFHYFKEISYEHINSSMFFNALKKENGIFLLRDKYHPTNLAVNEQSISFSEQYGGVNIVTIQVDGTAKLHLHFLRISFSYF
jgi:hypothetical protein